MDMGRTSTTEFRENAMSDQESQGHRIDEGMEVTLHFTLKLEDGTVVDSTRDKAPATIERRRRE